MTVKLYDSDAYITEFEANVISCEKTEHGYKTVLDKTAFFPTEGGQYHDSGTVNGVNVTDVYIEDGRIIHILESEVSGRCTGVIDFDERFDKMQQHTGEHIVCGIVHKLYGYDNVGFHLGPDDVTFDFNGPLTKKQLDEAELLANKAVTDNRAVKAYYPENIKQLSYRSKLDLEQNVRIVEIEGIDMCACCAPHVRTTGEVGYIKFTDAYSYKGGTRIHLACGMRAVRDAQIKFENLLAVAKALSASPNNTAEFFKKYTDDVLLLKQSLSKCKKELVLLKANAVTPSDSIVIFENDIDPSFLRQYVNALSDKYQSICAVFCKSDIGYNYCIASKTIDLGEFVRRFNSEFSGKGGGSSRMIQGSVKAARKDIEKFIK